MREQEMFIHVIIIIITILYITVRAKSICLSVCLSFRGWITRRFNLEIKLTLFNTKIIEKLNEKCHGTLNLQKIFDPIKSYMLKTVQEEQSCVWQVMCVWLNALFHTSDQNRCSNIFFWLSFPSCMNIVCYLSRGRKILVYNHN